MARSWSITYCVELFLDLARGRDVGEEGLGHARGGAAPGRGSTGRARCIRRRCRRRRGLRPAGRRRGSSCGRRSNRRSSWCRRSSPRATLPPPLRLPPPPDEPPPVMSLPDGMPGPFVPSRRQSPVARREDRPAGGRRNLRYWQGKSAKVGPRQGDRRGRDIPPRLRPGEHDLGRMRPLARRLASVRSLVGRARSSANRTILEYDPRQCKRAGAFSSRPGRTNAQESRLLRSAG